MALGGKWIGMRRNGPCYFLILQAKTSDMASARATVATRACRVLIKVALVALLSLAVAELASAQKLDARYAITMTGLRVGQSTWKAAIGEERYSADATGGSVDLLSIFAKGEGVAQVTGTMKNGALLPASFSSSMLEDGEHTELKITFEEGNVTDLVDKGPVPADRVPLREEHMRGVSDPLSALLLANSNSLARQTCERTLAIFDGWRRYDLVLSFKRMEELARKPYEGRVLVCNVVLRPIAGHRANSMVMKYIAGRRDIEIAFAPIASAGFLAPLRLSVPTLLGTISVDATQFDTAPLATPVPQ
jgi:hypothetical protein